MWLYVPGTSSPSAQASEDLSSALCSLSTAAPKLVEAFVTWRGNQQLLPAWSRRWRAGGFIRLLSGLTCSPSTLDHGVDSFISSLRETPARRTASPESTLEPRAHASSPPRSAASPMSAGLILSSAKTSLGMRTGNSRPSSRHWSDWATALRLEYSARPRPEIPCGASDSSSWPSASVMDTGDNTDLEKIQTRREKHKARGINGNGFGASLAEEARRWAAPRTSDTNGAGEHGDGGQDLRTQASNWYTPLVADAGEKVTLASHQDSLLRQAAQWPGPAARDFKGVNRNVPTPDYNARPLNEVASDFRPPSSPDQPIAGGSMSSTDGPNTNQPSAKRKLNPIFVEALMRWPTGLSGFERQETAWIRWWLLMPSFVSVLVSQKPKQGSLF